MNWNDIVNKVIPYVVRIETPSGHGTGYASVYNVDRKFVGIATAHHVVEHADQWHQPIRIHHQHSGKVAFLKEDDRFIFSDLATDSAIVLIESSKLQFPEPLIQLRPIEDRLPIGVEVGWLGYPGVTTSLCFFAGNISAYQEGRHAYLIDGVAINGVSGGPVLYSHATDGVQIVGSITAYMANRATGETLPGLSVAQDVSHHHEITAQIKDMDDAIQKQNEEKARKADPPSPSAEAPTDLKSV
jgi:hypothetical protein